jgi:hypothetical protein
LPFSRGRARRILKVIMRLSELSNSDKLTIVLSCVGGAVTFILYLLVKTPTVILVMCVAIVGLMVYPILHLCQRWTTRCPAFIGLLLIVLFVGRSAWPPDPATSVGFPTLKESVPAQSAVPPPTLKLGPVTDQTKKVAYTKVTGGPAPGIVSGSNNTTVGKVPFGTINGNGNTFVGPTDSNGNTIIPAGTAIGAGARADQTSVAIGAGAGAGSQSQPDHSIINNNSPNIGSQVIEDNRQYGTPRPPPHVRIVEQTPIEPNSDPADDPSMNEQARQRLALRHDSSHPGVLLTIDMDGGFVSPAFWVKCSSPCHLILGSLGFSSQTTGMEWRNDPTMTGISFVIPKQMQAGTKLTFQVRSSDSAPISIVGVGPYVPSL